MVKPWRSVAIAVAGREGGAQNGKKGRSEVCARYKEGSGGGGWSGGGENEEGSVTESTTTCSAESRRRRLKGAAAAAASSSPPTTRSTIRACGIGRWRLVDALGLNLHVRRGARSLVRWVRT